MLNNLPSLTRRLRHRLHGRSRLVASGIALLAVLFLFVKSRQVYHGLTLEEWFADYHVRGASEMGVQAFRENPGRGIPLLIGKLHEQETTLHQRYVRQWNRFPALLQGLLPEPVRFESPRDHAVAMLGELGVVAQPAEAEMLECLRGLEQQMKQDAPEHWQMKTLVMNGRSTPVLTPPNTRWKTLFSTQKTVNSLDSIAVNNPEFIALLLTLAQWLETPDMKNPWNEDNRIYASCINAFGNTNRQTALQAAYPLLKSQLTNRSGMTRYLAMIGLAKLVPNVGEATPLLIDALQQNGAFHCREMCLEALGRSKDYERVVPALIRELGDPAVRLPRHYVPTNSPPPMVLSDGRPGFETVQAALLDLGQRSDLVVPALVAALKDPIALTRANAARVLGRLGGKARAALPALQEAQADADETVRLSATEAYYRIERVK